MLWAHKETLVGPVNIYHSCFIFQVLLTSSGLGRHLSKTVHVQAEKPEAGSRQTQGPWSQAAVRKLWPLTVLGRPWGKPLCCSPGRGHIPGILGVSGFHVPHPEPQSELREYKPDPLIILQTLFSMSGRILGWVVFQAPKWAQTLWVPPAAMR